MSLCYMSVISVSTCLLSLEESTYEVTSSTLWNEGYRSSAYKRLLVDHSAKHKSGLQRAWKKR